MKEGKAEEARKMDEKTWLSTHMRHGQSLVNIVSFGIYRSDVVIQTF